MSEEVTKEDIENESDAGAESEANLDSPIPTELEQRIENFLDNASLPGIRKRVKNKYQDLLDDVTQSLTDFDQINSLKDNVKERIRNKVLGANAQVRAYSIIERDLDVLFDDVIGITLVLTFLIALIVGPLQFEHSFKLAEWPGWLIVIGILFVQIFLVIIEIWPGQDILVFVISSIVVIAAVQLEHVLSIEIPWLADTPGSSSYSCNFTYCTCCCSSGLMEFRTSACIYC